MNASNEKNAAASPQDRNGWDGRRARTHVSRRCCRIRRLSQQADQVDRTCGAWRSDGCAGALGLADTGNQAGPSRCCGESTGRGRRHRRACRRFCSRRRLHAPGRHLAVIPAVSTSAGYDPVKDFVPIVKLTEGFLILVVLPSSPWKTVTEFVEDSKANPTRINYAHTGPGGIPHLAGELFMLRSGARLTGVPYRSGGESLTGVLSGAVEATFEGVSILRSLINEGKLRALGAQTKERTPLLPQVPTMAELGLPDCEANTFYGLAAPAGTAEPIVKKISAVINDGFMTPDVQAMINNLASESTPNSPEEFAAFIAAQYRKWVEVGSAANVKIN
jgi:tripartite-type tricarboxylate transporter receptor subunit TctC